MRFAANLQPVRHFSPRALVRLAAGLALTLVYRGASSGRSRRRSPASHARCRASCNPAVCRFPARPSWRSAPTAREIASTSSEQNGSYVLRLSGAGNLSRSARRSPRLLRQTREATLAAERLQRADIDLVLVLASRDLRPSSAAYASRDRFRAIALTAGRAGPVPGRLRRPGRLLERGGPRRRRWARPRPFDRLRAGRVPAARRRHQRDRRTGRRCRPTDDATATLRAELQLPPGFSADAPTETVATAGIQGQSNDALLFGGRGGRGEFGEGGPDGFGRGGAGGVGGGAAIRVASAGRRTWRRAWWRWPRRLRPRRARRVRGHARRRTHSGQRQLQPRRVDVRCRSLPTQRSRA